MLSTNSLDTRPASSSFSEASASTGAERTMVREHRSAAETQLKLEIGGCGHQVPQAGS